jgi:hypothetical protein
MQSTSKSPTFSPTLQLGFPSTEGAATRAVSKLDLTAPAHHLQPAAQPLRRIAALIAELERTFSLPQDFRGFAIYTSGILLICTGMLIHIFLSAQILEAEYTIAQQKKQLQSIEQRNGELIWQIARESNLDRIEDRVKALGYLPITQREYVVIPSQVTEPMVSAAAVIPVVEVVQDAPAAANPWSSQLSDWGALFTADTRPARASGRTPALPQTNTVSAQGATRQQWKVWWEEVRAAGDSFSQQFVRGN